MRSMTRPGRSAFSLMELILVLAIVVIASAVAVPVVSTMIADSRMSAAGDQVRGGMAETRARAMDQCRPWRMAFLPGTGVYQIAPDDGDWSGADHEPTEKVDLLRDQLPKGIVFGSSEHEISGGQGGSSGGGGWTTICVYKSDGTGQDDATTYFGKPGLIPMRIKMRAFTGSVTVETPILVKGQP
jgi:prepilin-type N-terminal cleavage/methylation domain-containing protein